jgi:DNA-binding response OmpR family regulator
MSGDTCQTVVAAGQNSLRGRLFSLRMSRVVSPPRVLLIEDSFDDAFFFKRALNKTGIKCELTHVSDGATALAELEKCVTKNAIKPPPDLVFVDLKLPIYDGFEILSWLRAHAGALPLHVAVLSGSEAAADIARAKSLGAEEYFAKPISTEKLRARFSACGFHAADMARSPRQEDPCP